MHFHIELLIPLTAFSHESTGQSQSFCGNLNTANLVAKKFHVKRLISFDVHIATSISAEMLKLLDSGK